MKFRVIALAPAEFAKWLADQKKPARAAAPMAPAPATPAVGTMAILDMMGRDAMAPLSGTGDAREAFKAWQTRQQAVPEDNAKLALISDGRRLFKEKTCVNCHTVRGHEGAGVNAPDLTHIGSRSTIAAGLLENTEARLKDWLINPDHWKPSNKMFHGVGGSGEIVMAGYIKADDNKHPMMDASGQPVRNIALTSADVTALTAYLQSLK